MSMMNVFSLRSALISIIYLFFFSLSTIFIQKTYAVTYRTEAPIDVAVGSPPPETGGTGPTDNNCNGFYNFTDKSKPGYNGNPKKNFGDQSCEYASNPAAFKDNLLNLIDQKYDPGYKAKWSIILQGESGYRPNAWAPPVGTQAGLNGSGAWGMLQMGSAEINNGQPDDRGDVYWLNQMQNGISYNNALTTHGGRCGALGNAYRSIDSWCYWATAAAFAGGAK